MALFKRRPGGPPPPPAVAKPPPPPPPIANSVAASFRVGDKPQVFGFGGGRVWVAGTGSGDYGSPWLLWIDPATNQVSGQMAQGAEAGPSVPGFGPPRVGSLPRPISGLAVLDDKLWVLSRSPHRLFAYELPTLVGAGHVDVGKQSEAMTVAHGSIWIACGPTLWQVDPSSSAVVSTIKLDTSEPFAEVAYRLCYGAGSLWVVVGTVGGGPGWIVRVDPMSGAVVATIRDHERRDYGPTWFYATAGSDSIWVSSYENSVIRIDAATNEIVARIPCAGGHKGIVSGAGSIWLLHGPGVSRIDPEGCVFTTTIALPISGWGQTIAFGAGSVWVADDKNSVFRIQP